MQGISAGISGAGAEVTGASGLADVAGLSGGGVMGDSGVGVGISDVKEQITALQRPRCKPAPRPWGSQCDRLSGYWGGCYWSTSHIKDSPR